MKNNDEVFVQLKGLFNDFSERASVKHDIALTRLYEKSSQLDYEKAKKGRDALDRFHGRKPSK